MQHKRLIRNRLHI